MEVFEFKSNEKMQREVDGLTNKATSKRFFTKQLVGVIKAARVNTAPFIRFGESALFRQSVLEQPEVDRIVHGASMEQIDEMVKKVNEDLRESKTTLEELHNQIHALMDQIKPVLLEHIRVMRDSRMTTVREIGESLTALRDIRKFFLESDYDKEMKRLTDFLSACKELQELKNNGTLDAISDTIIKLAIKEVKNND